MNEGVVRKDAKTLHEFVKSKLSSSEKLSVPTCDYEHDQGAFRYVDGYYAPGYGSASPRVHQLIRDLKDLESIQLDATYSGKALLFVRDQAELMLRSQREIPKTLFWFTYNSHSLKPLIESHPWTSQLEKWRDLPPAFWPLFKNASF